MAEAPEHFFLQEDWHELVNSCGSREKALERISWKPDGFFRLTLQQAAELPAAAGARAQEAERIDRLVERVLSSFLAMLISGELVATGFQHSSLARERIAAELWRDLVLNFETGSAEGNGYAIRHIRIARATAPAGEQEAIVQSMTAWLRQRRDKNGDELKKGLSDAAQIEFGDKFTTRAFDAAYTRVYGRKRGRPRKSAK